VQGTTISALVRDFGFPRIDVLKIDIEGADVQIFGGDCSWLALTSCILIELHLDVPGSAAAFFKAIEPFGFEVSQHGDTTVAIKKGYLWPINQNASTSSPALSPD